MPLRLLTRAAALPAALVLIATVVAGRQGHAAEPTISGDAVKIGIMNDQSGLYADLAGPGSVVAAKMAIDEFGGTVLGKKIELVVADHQNKADIGAAKAREWFDRDGVTLLIGGTNSATGLSMNTVAGEKKKVYINIGAGADAMTNEQCTPYTVHYAYDTTALARGTGSAVVKRGGKSWFFLTADYAFGKSLEKNTSAVVKNSGGTVVGDVLHPLNASDFSSFLLQAQASKAQILGLANAGGDTVNSIKAAKEFGINKTMQLAGLLMFISDVHSLGLEATQGMYVTDSW
jgi:branched-chain amino acid transport system substrate-binding protein